MPWYAEMSRDPKALEMFQQQYKLGWQIAKALAPSPSALVGIITTPLSLLFVWLIYGVLAHLSARILGGQGSVGQTLACTALAVAPQLLNVITVLPFATAAGVGTWTLVCNFCGDPLGARPDGMARAGRHAPAAGSGDLGGRVVCLRRHGVLIGPVAEPMGGAR